MYHVYYIYFFITIYFWFNFVRTFYLVIILIFMNNYNFQLLLDIYWSTSLYFSYYRINRFIDNVMFYYSNNCMFTMYCKFNIINTICMYR